MGCPQTMSSSPPADAVAASAAASGVTQADSAVRPSSARWPALDGMRGLMTVGVFVAHVSYQ